MALLYAPRFQALDASANPIPGARLYTFDGVSTSTPKATYSDAALTVSYGAYVTADSSGVFPPIYGAADEVYYMVLRTSAGVFVDEFPSVTMLGPDSSSALVKDLGANGRFQVSGNGGVVQIETGNAEGDDIGGSGRIGGWDDTQGDDLELDYAAITATGDLAATGGLSSTSGLVTLGGIARAVPRALLRGTATAAVTTNLALDNAYEAWEIHIRNLQGLPVAGYEPGLRLSFDGAGSFKSGGTDYRRTGVIGVTLSASSAGTYMSIVDQFAAATPTGGGAEVIIRITSKAARETHVHSTFGYFNGSTTMEIGQWYNSTANKNYGKATHAQISDVTLGSGGLTFDYVVIGLP
jgi:hypothetical protein